MSFMSAPPPPKSASVDGTVGSGGSSSSSPPLNSTVCGPCEPSRFSRCVGKSVPPYSFAPYINVIHTCGRNIHTYKHTHIRALYTICLCQIGFRILIIQYLWARACVPDHLYAKSSHAYSFENDEGDNDNDRNRDNEAHRKLCQLIGVTLRIYLSFFLLVWPTGKHCIILCV